VVDLWLQDMESLEAVAQDELTKLLCLRMAAMWQAGTLRTFLATLDQDGELDEGTRSTIAVLAADERFLLSVDDYVRRTSLIH
jgi:cytosine/adenosine deaminase-related metal-dependent hydrolase